MGAKRDSPHVLNRVASEMLVDTFSFLIMIGIVSKLGSYLVAFEVLTSVLMNVAIF
jgi:hypothetical protein